MTKLLRLLTLSMLILVCGGINAQTTITFDSKTDKASSDKAGAVSLTKDAVTINAENGILGNGKEYRFYKGKKVTLTTTKDQILSVEFTCTKSDKEQYGPGCFTAASGEYTFSGKVGTWTGEASSVVFTATDNQVRATKIVVTIGKADPTAVKEPTITGNATFETSTTVTITGPEGADIYYTTDDSTPTTSSQKYTAPFSLTESTTVNAIAVKGGKSSTVASKDFSKITCTDATLEEVVGWTADKTYVKLALNNAKVIYADGNTVHLRENGKCLMLYNVGILALTLNSTVSGSIKMNFKSYNGIPEMMKNEFTNAGDLSITAGSSLELDATVTTVEDLLAKKNLCDLVLLKNVTVTAEGTGKDAKYFIVSGAKKIQLWGNQNLSAAGVGKSLDIYALCNSIYSNNVQIKPVKVGDITLGINNTIVVESKKQGIYNVNGVKMSEGQSLPAGLYIKNGKKVIVK